MPDDASEARPRDESPWRHGPFRLSLVATALALTGFSLLLPVVPLWAVRQGAGTFAAGAATGVFMASTVVTQLGTGLLVRRYGYRTAILAGIAFLGVPTPVLIEWSSPEGILTLSLLRGIGFGLLTVCGSALIAELLPPAAVPRGSGIYGLATGLPQLIGLPAGPWLAEHWGFVAVFLLATVLPALALLPAVFLPPARPSTEPERGGGFLPTVRETWRPWLPMLAASTGLGALATFTPILLLAPGSSVALLLMPLATTLSRWAAGRLGTRWTGRLLTPGRALSGLGLAGYALFSEGGPVWLVVMSMIVFGIGFGAVQNDSLVSMFQRTSAGRASISWNVAFDAGQGLGAVAVGAIVSGTSYVVAFGLLAAWSLALLPVAVAPRRAG
ncbi:MULTISPECIES: MFS transporter [Prauserella salsuginis group]|uniref:MFS transporter n=1 Tax=Prauserella salsuginis TaxID=387889 RepID=A0ABW6G507_9PSEU|nr:MULTISPECIES: MFS transporter [Prauserella salsuginis group]MCR3718824.1 putative arabinose efflux permease, MFS family [Prauserella flava]MCR3733394.1 putative arabinose efflux permease, MFS family [Prauserella salsuginis]